MNPETIQSMCKKAERMKQKQYEGRIQNLTGGYYKAGYENVKISQVKDYFLIHGKNYAMPNVFKELAEVEQYQWRQFRRTGTQNLFAAFQILLLLFLPTLAYFSLRETPQPVLVLCF